MAGRNTAVEQFRRRLRLSRLEARWRLAGASCGCLGLSGLGRSGRRRAAGSGRDASTSIHTSGRLPRGGRGYTIPVLVPDPELFAAKVLLGEGGPIPELFAAKS